MEEDRQKIEQVLRSFFTEEMEWERLCDNQLLTDAERNQIIASIFDKYITPKERKYGDSAIRSYGNDDIYNYNPEKENIESIDISGSKAVVTSIKEDPFRESSQYVLRKTNKGWLIDSKKIYSTWEKKWKRTIV